LERDFLAGRKRALHGHLNFLMLARSPRRNVIRPVPPQFLPASDTCARDAGFVKTILPASLTGAAHSNSPRGRKACYPAEEQGETVFSSLAL